MSSITYEVFERDFRVQRQLGRGSCSLVSLVQHMPVNKYYAMKVTETGNCDQLSQCLNELQTMNSVDDENLVKIHYYYLRESRKGKFQLGLIMDLCGCNLSQEIEERAARGEKYSPHHIMGFVTKFVSLFVKLQQKGYLHRDIKPDNVLTVRDRPGEYKLADFGFAVRTNLYSRDNVAGTHEYVSPKLLAKFINTQLVVPGNTFKDDVYSFGRTLLDMLLLTNGAGLERKLEAMTLYGHNVAHLIQLMLKDSELQRPDFIALEKELVLMRYFEGQPKVSQVGEKILDSLRKEATARKGSRNYDVLKTRKRQMDTSQACDPQVTKEAIHCDPKVTKEAIHKGSRTDIPKQELETDMQSYGDTVDAEKRKSDLGSGDREFSQLLKKGEQSDKDLRVYEIRSSIHSCECVQDNWTILGLEGQLAVLYGSRIIRVLLSADDRPITVLKFDSSSSSLYAASLNCSLKRIDWAALRMQCLVSKKNRLDCLEYTQFKVLSPVSCLELIRDSLKENQPDPSFGKQQLSTVLLGHYSGALSIVSEGVLLTLAGGGITVLQYVRGVVYTGDDRGIFCRQSFKQLVLLDQHKYIDTHRVNHYVAYSPITGCRVIADCLSNQRISFQKDQLLALLVTLKGFLHIVSRGLQCLRLLRLTDKPVLASYFHVDIGRDYGGILLALNEDGQVIDQEGHYLRKTKCKGMSSISSTGRDVCCSSYEGVAVVFTFEP